MSKLHNFSSGQIIQPDVAKWLLIFIEDGTKRYISFPHEWYITKSTKLSDAIKKISLPKFKEIRKNQPSSNINIRTVKKKLCQVQHQIDVARLKGVSMRAILSYEHTDESMPFHGDMTMRPDKSSLVKALEDYLEPDDYKDFNNDKEISTIIVDLCQ